MQAACVLVYFKFPEHTVRMSHDAGSLCSGFLTKCKPLCCVLKFPHFFYSTFQVSFCAFFSIDDSLCGLEPHFVKLMVSHLLNKFAEFYAVPAH
jgi:hypothetical protein